MSAICALLINGVLCVDLTYGTIDGSKYFDFKHGKLIPEMKPFDDQNENSILILDNCAIHHIQEVKDVLRAAGILVCFLPPYSPDFNPVEELFSYVKKEHDLVLQSIPTLTPVIQGWPNAAPGATSAPLLTFGGPCTIFFLEHNAVNALESGVNKLREASICMHKEDAMQVRGPRYLCGHKKRPP